MRNRPLKGENRNMTLKTCNIKSVTNHHNEYFRKSTINMGQKAPLMAVFITSLL